MDDNDEVALSDFIGDLADDDVSDAIDAIADMLSADELPDVSQN